MAGFDLHTHCDASDGTTSVEANVRTALALGLEGLGVTDHDTTAAWDRATAIADGTGLEIVPGTEFSAEHDGASVHVLGYWVDPADARLAVELDRLRHERTHRARAIAQRLRDLGVPVSFDRILELAGEAPIARPHVAAAVVEVGGAASAQEAFDRFLADGGPAHVPKHAVDPVRAVELLTAAGGVAVLAHPGLYGARDGRSGTPNDLIEEMAAAGLCGIEVEHPEHTEQHRAHYADLAVGLGLVQTAGSDYHGTAKANRLGEVTTPSKLVDELRCHARGT